MRLTEIKLQPTKIQITQEEILADLRYPARAERREARKNAKRR
jgi:hypothetical protein